MSRKVSPQALRAQMRNAPEEDPEFQIAPMIDILLVLLVFFMSIASTEVLQTNDAISLPVAKDAKDADKTKGQVVVNVLWNPISNVGTVEVAGQKAAAPDQIIPNLKDKVAANPDTRVLVQADRNVRYDYMRALLRAVGESGVSNVTFAVVDKEAGPPKGATASAP